jgi:hypothetical protein
MPFDPTYPPANALIESAPMRGQFQSLKALIDAVPTITTAQVDAVTTLNPGEAATVGVSITGGVLHLTFGIPQGVDGAQGNDGAPGPPFANAVVDSVTTVPAGTPADVGVSFDGTDVHFSFQIPQGEPGEQGPAGEVSQGDLETALGSSSSNSNDVSFLNFSVNDPPTQQDVQLVVDKVDELLQALRR